MHEYDFNENEDDNNLGGNRKQIKTRDVSTKLPAIVHILTQILRVNPKVDIIRNNCKTRKVVEF